jgi:sortase A
MKKTISIIFACVLCMTLAIPAFAYNYEFGSGADTTSTFGKPTSNDEPVSPDPMSQNVRRNKDNSALPPPYFYGSGDIPTGASSLYHDNTPPNAGNGYEGLYSTGMVTADSGVSTSFTPPASGFEASTSIVAVNTAPKYNNDGSIGTLYVERTKKTIKIYEGEQLDNLKKGAGHFESTSAWDGNVALAGHNRGSSAYFSFVKDLHNGDKLTYTTPYGTRTYEVISVEKISETDYSKLGWSAENLLTLITCVADIPEQRYAAVCREEQ